jgi:hypothetical protein
VGRRPLGHAIVCFRFVLVGHLTKMDPSYPDPPPIRAIFDGARLFGLTDEDAWRAFDVALDEVGTDATVDEYLDELTGELARRILDKHRAEPSEEPRVASRDRL